MKTNLYKTISISLFFLQISNLVQAQGNTNGQPGNSGNSQNCVVSSINGPNEVDANVNYLYYVTSNGQHIWTFPTGVTVLNYGSSGNDSVTVKFSSEFNSGSILVRRNGPSCTNVVQSMNVTRRKCNMSITLGEDRKTYYGYAPMECALINPVIFDGTSPYKYQWSDGSSGNNLNACLSQSGDVSLTVTDARGCTATDQVHICVTDVRCNAGNSSIQKVEVCHKTGKSICVNQNAVPALLRIGGNLGNCSEIYNCASATQTSSTHRNMLNNKADAIDQGDIILDVSTLAHSKTLYMDMLINGDSKYKIFDITGKMVQKGILNDGENHINIHDLKSGIYLLTTEFNQDEMVKFYVE